MSFSRRACAEMRLIGRSTSIRRLGYVVNAPASLLMLIDGLYSRVLCWLRLAAQANLETEIMVPY